MDSAVGRAALHKVAWRLIPFLGVLYFFAFLDRVNVGFAALTMNADLGLSSAVFGIGAGIFFVGYIAFEVPSNVMLDRFGARVWIARIMISWGVLSAAMALVQGPKSFYAVRFLLFMIALPLSSIMGAPISTALLDIDMNGLHGWQWMFVLEAVPTIVLGVVVLNVLPDRPLDAKWLGADEKHWLVSELERERADRSHDHTSSLRRALMLPRVWRHGLVYFCILVGLYGFAFWLPQIIASQGTRTNVQVGMMTMVPYTLACIALVLWGRHSDATEERAWHVAAPSLLGAVALMVSGWVSDPGIAFVALCLAAVGIYSGLPCFWAMASHGLQGAAAAGAIALINSLGNFGGFLGPAVIGLAKDVTGSYAASFLFIAVCLATGAVFSLVARKGNRAARSGKCVG